MSSTYAWHPGKWGCISTDAWMELEKTVMWCLVTEWHDTVHDTVPMSFSRAAPFSQASSPYRVSHF